jgi:tricorn protease
MDRNGSSRRRFGRVGRGCLGGAFGLLALGAWLPAAGAAERDARFLHQPAVHAETVAFVSEGELWTAPLAGGPATRLTSDGIPKWAPRFSPDGSSIAYAAGGDSSRRDVFVLPRAGGTPRRLTWHPADDVAEGWSADGASVLVASGRGHHGGSRWRQLYSVRAAGGAAQALLRSKAFRGAVSPDGAVIAYTPTIDNFQTWRRYRGGEMTRIRLTDRAGTQHAEVPGGSGNDTNPIWIGGRLYFLSDRTGTFGIYAYDPASGAVSPVLVDPAHDMDWLGGAEGRLVFAAGGHLWRHELGASGATRIGVRLPDTVPQRVSGDVSQLTGAVSLAPDGRTLLAEARGDLFLKRLGAPAVNLTNTSGIAERAPVWSPDGSAFAYVSDASGEYELHVRAADTRARPRRLGVLGPGFPAALSWSPDGRRIVYLGGDRRVRWVSASGGRHRKGELQALTITTAPAWMPDGRSLFFIARTAAGFGRAVHLDLDTGRETPVTDELAHVSELRLSNDGRALYLVASVEAGPATSEYDMSRSLYLQTARSSLYSIDLSGSGGRLDPATLAARMRAVPGTAGRYGIRGGRRGAQIGRALFVAPDGTVLTVQQEGVATLHDWYGRDGAEDAPPPQWTAVPYRPDGVRVAAPAPAPSDAMTLDRLLNEGQLHNSASPNRLLFSHRGKAAVAELGAGGAVSIATLELGPLQATTDLRAERLQMFDETVRRYRDYFHDARMSGLDWAAQARRFRAMVPETRVRSDLDYIFGHLVGQLENSHIFTEVPPAGPQQEDERVGYVGADFTVENGRYVVSRILDSSPWDTVRGPLAGTGIGEGDALVAVAGRPIDAGEDISRRMAGLAGEEVALSFLKRGAAEPVTVTVRAVSSEGWLRRRDHVERLRRYVHQRSGGRIGYVHQPDTYANGLAEFQRYFFPQADREALIIDARFNNGGLDPDFQIDYLARIRQHVYRPRNLDEFAAPTASIDGPMVMLSNESAGSGGDMYPYQFKLRGLGRVIGTRTHGGVNGGYRNVDPAALVDGGRVAVPDLRTLGPNGEPILENVGFVPDEEVPILPADYEAGRDPQLDRAIDYLMAQLGRAQPSAAGRSPSR